MNSDPIINDADKRKPIYSIIGLCLGSLSLLLALFHFWAGPFAPQPTLEKSMTEVVSSLKNAAENVVKGIDAPDETIKKSWTIDDIIDVIIPMLGGLAIILALIGFAIKEPGRIAIGGIVLGASGIIFQLVAMLAVGLLVILLIYVVLATLGIG